jgi:acetolactate synthase-1/2/3 large subunit
MKLSGAEILMKILLENGVTDVFGYPGGTVLDIYDRLYKYADKIKHHITAHEQGAAHAADGYARASAKTGVVIATSGPGSTNIVTGLATAYLDSVPVVAITGNVANNLIGRDSFQEVDTASITMSITKHNYVVKHIDELQPILREAFLIAKSGRPGPVLVDIPKDIQQKTIEFLPAAGADAATDAAAKARGAKTASPKQYDLSGIIRLLNEAKKPFIYAGGGVIIADACEELKKLSELVDAPVGASLMGLTCLPSSNPRFLGMVGMHGRYAASRLLSECDLLIGLGIRFSDRATGNKKRFSENRKIIQIDIDDAEINKNITTDLSITGDLKAVLKQLLGSLKPKLNPEWSKNVAAIKSGEKNNPPLSKDAFAPKNIIECVARHIMDDGSPIVTDVGQHQMWTAQFYPFKKPRTLLTSGGLGTMGYGMGAAIGACLASGRRRTVLFTSDGSFHMNLNETATAVTNNLPIVIVLLDNNALGMVRQWQKVFYEGRFSQTTLNRKTNYADLARAFGADGYRAATMTELEKALSDALKKQTPSLIHCIIDSDERVLPMIPPGGTLEDIILN